MSDLQAKVSTGDHKGKPLYPHLHKDGKYVASPTRFEIDYIRVDELDELEVLVRSGYAARMSNPEIPHLSSLVKISTSLRMVRCSLPPSYYPA